MKTKPRTKTVQINSKLKTTAVSPITNRNEYLKGHPKLGGRAKGTKNKFTTLKNAFINSFQKVGGEEALNEFYKIRKNRKAYLQMIASMLPRDVQVTAEITEVDKEKNQFSVERLKAMKKTNAKV